MQYTAGKDSTRMMARIVDPARNPGYSGFLQRSPSRKPLVRGFKFREVEVDALAALRLRSTGVKEGQAGAEDAGRYG